MTSLDDKAEQPADKPSRKFSWWRALPIGSNIRETIQDIKVIRESLRKNARSDPRENRSETS